MIMERIDEVHLDGNKRGYDAGAKYAHPQERNQPECTSFEGPAIPKQTDRYEERTGNQER